LILESREVGQARRKFRKFQVGERQWKIIQILAEGSINIQVGERGWEGVYR
jgi:hypothetical protein